MIISSLQSSLKCITYSAAKNSLLHNFINPKDVEGRELIILKVMFIDHVVNLNVLEIFSVPESAAFCML